MIQSISEWPWQTIVFVITFGITILDMIRLLSLAFGKGVHVPFQSLLDQWYVFHPCFFYQIYWWSTNYIL